MQKIKSTSRVQNWSLNLRNRVGDSVIHNGVTYSNISGRNSEPPNTQDWIPTNAPTPTLDQVVEQNPVTARDVIFQKNGEQSLIFQRLGNVGITDNPRFLVGRIVNGGINEPKFRIGFQDDTEYTTEVFSWEVEPSGTMASLRQVVGSHIEGFIGTQVEPMYRISSTDLGLGNNSSRLELGPGGTQPTDVFLERTGNNEFRIVLSGGTKQIWYADAIFTPSGIMQVFQESTTPTPAGAGTVKLYSKNGQMHQMDESGVEASLVTSQTGSQIVFPNQQIPRGTGTGTVTSEHLRFRLDPSEGGILSLFGSLTSPIFTQNTSIRGVNENVLAEFLNVLNTFRYANNKLTFDNTNDEANVNSANLLSNTLNTTNAVIGDKSANNSVGTCQLKLSSGVGSTSNINDYGLTITNDGIFSGELGIAFRYSNVISGRKPMAAIIHRTEDTDIGGLTFQTAPSANADLEDRLSITSYGQVDVPSSLTVKGNRNVRNYRVYTAEVFQADPDPNLQQIIFDNDLGGAIAWTKFSDGNYLGTLSGAFTLNKTHIITSRSSGGSGGIQMSSQPSENTVQLLNFDSSGALSDNFRLFIEIKVYD